MGTVRLRLLLDTNVLVDEHIPMRPHAEDTRALLTLAVTQGHRLLYSARVLPDVYFQICQYYKRQVLAERGEVSETDALAIQEIAMGCIHNLCEISTAVGHDESNVWLARKYYRFSHDLEDNFILAAAERAKADYLITSDKGLLGKATVAALTPKDMHSLLEARAE